MPIVEELTIRGLTKTQAEDRVGELALKGDWVWVVVAEGGDLFTIKAIRHDNAQTTDDFEAEEAEKCEDAADEESEDRGQSAGDDEPL
jgi:hypothetical protein